MSNLFGATAPIIYIGETQYQLPMPSRGGRDDHFPKEGKRWTDPEGEKHERIKGYRLKAEYEYEFIDNDDLENLITIFNAISDSSNIKLKFSTLPRKYAVIVDDFEKPLSDGYVKDDAAKISFIGKKLLKEYPNPDNVYSILLLRGKGLVVNTLADQGITYITS